MRSNNKEFCELIFKEKVQEHYSRIKELIHREEKEFLSMQNASKEQIFQELCFCILAANFSAEGSLKIQQELGNQLLTLPLNLLKEKLRELHHRFPNKRAEFIVLARRHLDEIYSIIQKIKKILRDDDNYNKSYNKSLEEFRMWLVNNIKGVGLKESSHFLRNIGFLEFPIIDFHIINLLVNNSIIEKPKTLTKSKYLQIEGELIKLSKIIDLKPGLLDLVLWHMETGKIIK